MKAVKAYIRTAKVEEVVHALEKAGVCDVTVIDVMAVGSNVDPNEAKYSIELMQRYSRVAKLEIVCKEDNIHTIIEILRNSAFTGQPGDGIVYVTPVEMAVKIRTGAIGEEGL